MRPRYNNPQIVQSKADEARRRQGINLTGLEIPVLTIVVEKQSQDAMKLYNIVMHPRLTDITDIIESSK